MRKILLILFLFLMIIFIVNITTISMPDSCRSQSTANQIPDKIFIELSDEELELRHWIKLRELANEILTQEVK